MVTLQEMANLSVLYGQKHRHYHDIIHIQNALAELEACRQIMNLDSRAYDLIETSIWYHDCVYNPYSKLNEYQSAELALAAGHPYVIRDIIMATAKHTTTQNFEIWNNPEDVELFHVMLDIDLSGFGKSTEVCLANGENVRAEYYNTSDYDFAVGRLKFVEAIRKRETLYYSEYFHEKYHAQSVINLGIEEELARAAVDDLSGM